MHETRPADPGARRLAVWLLAAVALFGGAAVLALDWMQPRLEEWVLAGPGDPVARAQALLRAAGLALGALTTAPAAYCYALASRIDAAGEFPPPGMKLVREARVLRGDAARGRAWILRALAIKLALLGLSFAVLCWVFAGRFLS